MVTVSIIIPTLFPPPTLREYVERLAKYKSVKEVIVAINSDRITMSNDQDSSNDQYSIINDFKRITRDISSIKMVTLVKNMGFTGACNAGAKVATGEYLLFLNDDCEMDEENFVKIVEFLEKNQDLVATQPIVYKNIDTSRSLHPRQVSRSRDDAKEEIENIGFTVDTRIGKASAVQSVEILKRVQNDNQSRTHSADTHLYGLSGTCLLIRKDIFEKIGMWDESFHSYLEDVDLAIRMRKFGHKFAPCLDSEVTHTHMATSRRMGMYKPIQDMKNWWRLIIKHPDVFVHVSNLIPLLLERVRNMSGVMKKFLNSNS